MGHISRRGGSRTLPRRLVRVGHLSFNKRLSIYDDHLFVLTSPSGSSFSPLLISPPPLQSPGAARGTRLPSSSFPATDTRDTGPSHAPHESGCSYDRAVAYFEAQHAWAISLKLAHIQTDTGSRISAECSASGVRFVKEGLAPDSCTADLVAFLQR